MRRLLAGDERGFEGARFSLPLGARLRYPVERREVSLLVGSWSSKLTAFAAEAATELKVGGSANPDLVSVMRERVANPEVGLVFGAVTVIDEDGGRARPGAARGRSLPAGGRPPRSDGDARTRAPRAAAKRGRTERDASSRTASSTASRSQALRPRSPEQAEAILDAGASRVDFGTPHGIDERKGVDLLCRSVLPRLRVA